MTRDPLLKLRPIEPSAAIPLTADDGTAQLLGSAFAGTMQELIDDLPEQIAILDDGFNILAVNRAWRDVVTRHGYVNALPGYNYHTVCAQHAAAGYEPAAEAVAALDGLRSGKHSFWQLNYNGRERWDGRDFQICFHRIVRGDNNFTLVTRFDLTEINELRRLKSEFNRALEQGQASERLRLGRELHDGTSQVLTAIGLLICRLKREPLSAQTSALVEELQELLGEAHQEIRSISYLAHPPALDKLGLANAMKLLAEGFARRTGLEASFEILGEYDPVSATAKAAIYRLAQEALSNVHRHAHANRIRVQIFCRASATHFVIADDGVGIKPEALAGGCSGVGLASMRSRMAEIGARLTVRNLQPGTAIVASLPKGL